MTYDDERLTYIISGVCHNPEPQDPEDIVPKKQTMKEMTSDAYDNLLKDSSITLLTPKEEYVFIGQALEYRCNACGHEDSARHNYIGRKNKKGKLCKGCRAIERQKDLETLLWRRTKEYVTRKGGEIIKFSKKGEYYNKEDKLLVECENGHTWATRHKHIHNNNWCRSCAKLGKTPPRIQLRDFRKANRIYRYAMIYNMVGRNGMRLKFEMEGNRYYMICDDCGTATVLTQKQIESREYLCPDRCVRSHATSVFRNLIQKGGDYLSNSLTEEEKVFMNKLYNEGLAEYEKYCKLKHEMPKPKSAMKKKEQ